MKKLFKKVVPHAAAGFIGLSGVFFLEEDAPLWMPFTSLAIGLVLAYITYRIVDKESFY